MKLIGTGVLLACLWCGVSRAADVNLVTTSCAKYQNEIVGPAAPAPAADPINLMMWLFGYSVAKSGSHYMYGEALAGFGFALDAECKNNPGESLQDALAAVKPSSKNPMDLSSLDCATFSARHVDLARTDAESAKTIMMWLFGFAVATSGSHVYDSGAFAAFGPALLAECAKRPERSLFDALSTVYSAKAKN